MKEQTMKTREDFMKDTIREMLKGHEELIKECIKETKRLEEKELSQNDMILIEQSTGLLDSEEKIVEYLFKCYLKKGCRSFEEDIDEYFAEVKKIRNRQQIIYA